MNALSPACMLLIDLQGDEPGAAADMKAALKRAEKHAKRGKLTASKVQIETAAIWYVLIRLGDLGRYSEAQKLLPKAIRLGREDFSVDLNICVEDMADAEPERADRWTLAYLEDLYARDQPSPSDVTFWSQFVRANAKVLSNSEKFREKSFARGKKL